MTPEELSGLAAVLRPIQDATIIELGAHCGEDCDSIESAAGSVSRYIMVEPDKRNADVIMASKLKQHRRLLVAACGAQTEARTFYYSDGPGNIHGSGSMLEPTGHIEHFPQIKFSSPATVMCYSLDDIRWRENVDVVDLLYVDVQGAEKEVILGGKETLAKTRYLFIEAEEVEFYRDQALRPDLLKMLNGWTVIGTFDYNLLLKNERF